MEHPKSILRRHGLTAKKSLGQNFISDERLLARIADAARLDPADEVLEIGPGLGSLTLQLARRASRVVAVEIDDRLMPILLRELETFPSVELIQGDILELNPADHFQGDYKVVGNVPYYITGAILRHLLPAVSAPDLLVLTIQQEVADRIVSKPGQMSLLTVMVQFYAEAEILFTIKAGSFWPKPAVDSAVIRLTGHAQRLVSPDEEEGFFQLVRVGFSQRRKQLQKNLRALEMPRETLEHAFSTSGIDGRRRAQSLDLDEWKALYEALL